MEETKRTRIVSRKFCVYAHSVDGEVFYVGKGTGERAFNENSRNAIWGLIVSTFGYFDVEILGWFGDENDALKMESKEIRRRHPRANLIDGPGKRAQPRSVLSDTRYPVITRVAGGRLVSRMLTDKQINNLAKDA